MTQTVLCVDSGDAVGDVERAVEADPTLSPISATTAESATESIESEDIDALVTEYTLDDESGLSLIERLRTEQPQTPAVLFTDSRPGDVDTATFEETIVEYLSKDVPNAHDQLPDVVKDLIEHSAQVGYLLPDDEDERLEALAEYDIDELPTEESFERITDLIASHFGVEVAFIGLLERDEERFLACHGGDWGSLNREETICTHSMLQEDVMVIEDIATDNRFNKNEQLENLGIVSYAGANMTAPNGQVIGQVCVIDFERRSYDAEERAELQDFAETAMEILDLRQSLRSARGEEVDA